MPTNPLISIITINYNDKVGLERTIKSVVNQTYQEFEYIVIDGGSTDGSKELIEQYSHKITYWISEPDNGVYNAMNKGVLQANGEYLLFLNSGDEFFSSDVLEKNYRNIHSEDLIYFDIQQIFEDRTNIHQFPDEINYNTFLTGTIGHPTTFIKKKLFNKIGLYDETLKIVADWKFFSLAVIKHHCSLKKVNTVLSRFYMDGISSTNIETTNAERKKVLEENFTEYLRLNQLENLVSELKKSRLLKILNYFGFLTNIKKV
ncbi:MAG: glycosyltransferase [Vicingaceae bacterium]|nr:glycosyltransferase [Vicingaceae bacterium]